MDRPLPTGIHDHRYASILGVTLLALFGTSVASRSPVAPSPIAPITCTAPSITMQPSNATPCPGSPASFSVVASGTASLNYQWRKGTFNLTDGGNISGSSTATLTISPATDNDEGSYDVIVTNACGSVTSSAATLMHDTDGDGTPDCTDGCPTDPNKIAPGVCGCGVSDIDMDGDGTADCHDGCPSDPSKIAPGQCGCGVADIDTDGDGTADCHDGCPTDPNKVARGQCGCGLADTDSDGDGIADCHDNCPSVPNADQADVNGNGIGDACEMALTFYEPGTTSCPNTIPTESTCSTCNSTDSGALMNAFSGEACRSAVDLRILGRGFDLVISRKYRSRVGPSTSQGNGWDFSYNIHVLADGANLKLADGHSRLDSYLLQPDGSWAQKEFFRSITQAVDGSYTLTFADTGTWHFMPLTHPTAPGQIDAITSRNGNIMTFAYNAQGRLSVIYDTLHSASNPRPVTLAYNSDGFLESVTDWTGRQTKYTYYQNGDAGGGSGDLKSVTTPAVTTTPNGNDYPLGKTTVYTYSKGFSDDRLNHNLLTITDPKNQTYLTNVYSTTLDPSDITFDRVMRQVLGNPGDIIDYFYLVQVPSAANNFATIKTIKRDRNSNVSELFFDASNRMVMERRYTGHAPDPTSPTTETTNRPVGQLRPGDPPDFETRWEYNDDSLVTRITHPNLNEELFTYDASNTDPRAHGNLLQHCWLPGPLGGDQMQICESFEYDTGFGGCCGTNFVKKKTDGNGNITLHDYGPTGNMTHTTYAITSIVEDWEYNAFGQITAHVWPDNGLAHRRRDESTYYGSGPPTGFQKDQIVDATGFALTTTYERDSLGRPVRIINPLRSDTLVTYNALDQIVRTRSCEILFRKTTLAPLATEPSRAVRYEKLFFYDANDNLVRTDTQNVDDQCNVVASNPYFTTISEYDILNKQTRICQEKGSYDVPLAQLTCAGLPISEFITTEYAYDANRNQTLVRLGEATNGHQPANVVATQYDERDKVFRETRGAGGTTPSTNQSDYDENGNLERVSEGIEDEPHVRTAVHDGLDRIVSNTDAMGNVETYHYDANGNRASTRVDGELIDLPGSVGNQRLSEVTYTYDAMDREIVSDTAFFDVSTGAQIGDGHAITRMIYSANSQVIQVINDNSHATLTTYDSANRATITTDAKGNTVTYAYDQDSNIVSVSSAEKSDLGSPNQVFVTARVYDNLDRLTSEGDNVGNITLFHYDSRGNRTSLTDALGHHTKFVYDGANRLLQTIRDMNGNGPDASDSADIVTAQTWDDSSRLVGQTDDNGNTTVTFFDALDRRIGEQYADGTTQSSSLDVHGLAIQSTDANGSIVSATYDALDRVLQKSIVPGPGVSNDTTFEAFQYDGRSRLIRAENDESLVTRGYDSMSNVTREALNGMTTTSIYDGVGNELSSVYPGGRAVACTYDALERKHSISDQSGMIAAYSYQGPRRVERRDYGNGTRTTYIYDGIAPNPANDFGVKSIVRTMHFVIGSGAILDDRTYNWDRLANKTNRADIRAGGPMLVHDYGYDFANRLTQSVKALPGESPATISYVLDGVGNRMEITGGAHPGSYAMSTAQPDPADFQMNQYTSTPIDARQYDRNGNLVLITPGTHGNQIVYDYRNLLVLYPGALSMAPVPAGVVSVAPPQNRLSTTTRFHYDVLGRRMSKSVGTQTTNYYYHDWQVIEEQDGAGATLATYVYGKYVDEILNMRRGNVDFYYHADDNFDVMAVTNSSGVPVERYEYDDFGAPFFFDGTGRHIAGSAIGNAYLFAGRQNDRESNLYYLRTRYLDPATGRFTTRDSVGTWGDAMALGNSYTYAGNSPESNLDPTGKGLFGTCGSWSSWQQSGSAYCAPRFWCFMNSQQGMWINWVRSRQCKHGIQQETKSTFSKCGC